MRNGRWLWGLLACMVIFGLARLRFDAEVLNLLPASLSEVKGLVAYQEHFDGSNDLLITLKNKDADIARSNAELLSEFLRAEDGLTGSVRWQPPWDEFPEQASELTAAMWFNQPPRQLMSLLDRLAPEPLAKHLQELRAHLAISFSPEELARLSYDPLQLLDIPNVDDHGFMEIADDGAPFSSPMGDYRVVFVETPFPLESYKDAIAWLASMEKAVSRWMQGLPESDRPVVRFTGGPTFHSEISASMERDMKRSVLGTGLVVSVLFFFVHRRIKPLLWLLVMLTLVLVTTMGIGGLLLGGLNVVSLGFAAILLGLAVDYGLVLYQERQAHPELDYRSARQLVAPGILWSAFTTAIAFGLLNFCGLPGLAQLGTLVGWGVLVAALFMLVFYLRPLEKRDAVSVDERGVEPGTGPRVDERGTDRNVLLLTGVLMIGAVVLLLLKPPIIDSTSKPLRPARSVAYDAMEEFENRVSSDTFRWSIVVNGDDEQAVADELKSLREKLAGLQRAGMIGAAALPDSFWANPAHQKVNRTTARQLLQAKERVFDQVRAAGFTEDSLKLAESIFTGWEKAVSAERLYWPENEVSDWVVSQSSARLPDRMIAAGRIQPVSTVYDQPWEKEISTENVWIVGWDRLGPALMKKVRTRLQVVSVCIGIAVIGVLMMTFRAFREVLLSLGVLAFSGLMLLAMMSLLNWEWNLMNLMAAPLLLGGTVDYTIHTQLSLRRNGGDARRAFNSTGKALLLCAATTSVGFGSLGFSNNAGLASLGKVCSVGAICSVLVACFLLPVWWRVTLFDSRAKERLPRKPSKLYGALVWKMAGKVVQLLPLRVSRTIGVSLATFYSLLARRRMEVVLENLSPVFGNDELKWRSAARRLFRNFGIKIVDLLYFENGGKTMDLFQKEIGSVRFIDRLRSTSGTLLLTVHLGNWEYGAPLLKEHGVDLLVITSPEPGDKLTDLRRKARERLGIKTIVIGDGAFAFVDVLKRLKDGAVIALLMDRPPASSSVEVELFGRSFNASIAAAELARASGCALVPVVIPKTERGYLALTMDEIRYDRSRLNTHEARRALTQEILRAFEPHIRQYPDQWFHFVPIWAES